MKFVTVSCLEVNRFSIIPYIKKCNCLFPGNTFFLYAIFIQPKKSFLQAWTGYINTPHQRGRKKKI